MTKLTITQPTISRSILAMRVDYTTYDNAAGRIAHLAVTKRQGYVCICSVHMIMEGYDNPEFRRVVNEADLVTPDGMPLVWGLRWLGVKGAERVYGPFLTPRVCAEAEAQGIPVGFYGGTPAVLPRLLAALRRQYPRLQIAYAYSPPFRPLTEAEDQQVVAEIRESGAKIMFVGIGCPKQERWMAEHKSKIPAVMVGVGAAFDFIAGVKPQAPRLVQRLGLEWLFRLLTEPRRLWRRYLNIVPRFTLLFGRQLFGRQPSAVTAQPE